eukprot:762869-Hanusia_phi.AAC.2
MLELVNYCIFSALPPVFAPLLEGPRLASFVTSPLSWPTPASSSSDSPPKVFAPAAAKFGGKSASEFGETDGQTHTHTHTRTHTHWMAVTLRVGEYEDWIGRSDEDIVAATMNEVLKKDWEGERRERRMVRRRRNETNQSEKIQGKVNSNDNDNNNNNTPAISVSLSRRSSRLLCRSTGRGLVREGREHKTRRGQVGEEGTDEEERKEGEEEC